MAKIDKYINNKIGLVDNIPFLIPARESYKNQIDYIDNVRKAKSTVSPAILEYIKKQNPEYMETYRNYIIIDFSYNPIESSIIYNLIKRHFVIKNDYALFNSIRSITFCI